MEPLVTVVVPVGPEHTELVQQALRSLTNQTVPPGTFQVIVVNDSGKPLRVDEDASVLNTKGHQGTAIARNLGIQAVATPLVIFLDADDLMLHTGLETLIRGYALYDEASYVYGDHFELTPSGAVQYHSGEIYNQRNVLHHSIHTVTALMAKSTVDAVDGFDEHYKYWEDWEFYVRLAIAGHCGVKVPSPIITYRLATSSNRNRHNASGWYGQKEILDRYNDWYEGRRPLMGCCPGDKKAKMQAQQFIDNLPPGNSNNVTLEYLGENIGTVPFRMSDGTVYRGASRGVGRFILVRREHLQRMLEYGMWRLAAQPSTPTVAPTPQQVALPPVWKREPPKEIQVTPPVPVAVVLPQDANPSAVTLPPSVAPFQPEIVQQVAVKEKPRRGRKPRNNGATASAH